jgi:hypothetical protein
LIRPPDFERRDFILSETTLPAAAIATVTLSDARPGRHHQLAALAAHNTGTWGSGQVSAKSRMATQDYGAASLPSGTNNEA